VQILVVVANIQARTLKAEVEKGFARTAFDRELVDPKAQINLVKGDDRFPTPGVYGCGGGGFSPPLFGSFLRTGSNTRSSPKCRKGIGVNIPEPEFGRKAVRRRKRTRRRRPLPWEEFSFLFDDPNVLVRTTLEWHRAEIGSNGRQSPRTSSRVRCATVVP